MDDFDQNEADRAWLNEFDHSATLAMLEKMARERGLPLQIEKSIMRSPVTDMDIGDEFELISLFDVDRSGVAWRALQKKGRKERVQIGASLVIFLPVRETQVASIRADGRFAFGPAAFSALMAGRAGEILDELQARRESAQRNAKATVERLRAEPVSAVMRAQQSRERAILANQPTSTVDAWIVANMGYTRESLAALAKTTRRDRRREARQRMNAETT